MRVALRADANTAQGSGHVMRCLTLAEELLGRGHDVTLVGTLPELNWLRELVTRSGVRTQKVAMDSLDLAEIRASAPDVVVVDSYGIPAERINALAAQLPVMAIVDGDSRGIECDLYLDQNLGAELEHGRDPHRWLAGSSFALVRRAVRAARREEPWLALGTPPNVLVFMGGTDPTQSAVAVARSLAHVPEPALVTVIAPPSDHARIADILPAARVIDPTPDLPELCGHADVVVSAAGTSAWDIGTLGTPAVLVAVVDNQSAGLGRVLEAGLALGVDSAREPDAIERVGGLVSLLLRDIELRRQLSTAAVRWFDGNGPARVAGRIEDLAKVNSVRGRP